MTERVFVSKIHRLLKPVDVYVWKINARYVAGVPDAYYSGKGGDIWIEYKYVPTKTAPKRFRVNLSPLQRHWLLARHAEGRQVAVIVGVGKMAYILQDNDLAEDHVSTAGRTSYTHREIATWIHERTRDRSNSSITAGREDHDNTEPQ